MSIESISPEILKARAALAGVSPDGSKLPDLAFTMEQSLAAVRALDLRAMRSVAPAVTFDPAWRS